MHDNGLGNGAPLRAIVFDVDGTLYDQRKLRQAMLGALMRAHLFQPLVGWRTATVLRAYRHAQEELRQQANIDVGEQQYALACARTGHGRDFVQRCVETWMESAPLEFLPRCRLAGLPSFLEACRQRGVRLAVLSDYPATAKLRALDIERAFDLSLCAQSPEIGRFKPDPRGLLVSLDRLGVSPADALYVGDRADVDAAAAATAGVRCVIVAKRRAAPDAGFTTVGGYDELRRSLFGPDASLQSR